MWHHVIACGIVCPQYSYITVHDFVYNACPCTWCWVLCVQVFSPRVVQGAESIEDTYEEDDDDASSVVESFSQVS